MSILFDKALRAVDKDVKRFVDNSMDIIDQIHHILAEKNLSQKDLAGLLNKKESEISKWMSGTHNFTSRSISKMEAVLEENILITPLRAREKYAQVKFVPVSTYAKLNKPYCASKSDFKHYDLNLSNTPGKNSKTA